MTDAGTVGLELPAAGPRASFRAWVRDRLTEPVDVAGLAAFRVIFGLVVVAGIARFWAEGWIDTLLIQPRFQFKYWGFEWVRAWPAWGMYLHFGAVGVLGLMVAAGAFHRVTAPLLFLSFTYLELIDVTTYLNHYYLVSWLCLLLCFVPAHRAWSVDAWRNPALRVSTVPAWSTWLLRFQVGTVYFFAGIAKLGEDWLLHAQPLSIWMSARSDLPIIGRWLGIPAVAYGMSWAGFLFDTTIVLWLSLARTRLPAYVAVVAFHTLTGLFFDIGMFPFIMTTAALIFFPPGWPRTVLPGGVRRFLAAHTEEGSGPSGAQLPPRPSESVGAPPSGFGAPTPKHPSLRCNRSARRIHPAWVALAAAFCVFELAMPLRHLAYGGDFRWHEQGMRWAWHVMVREKNGSVSFRVELPDGREQVVTPRRYLTTNQEREMSGQPDLVLQLAHRIAEDYSRTAGGPVKIHADVLVSLNGRRAAPLIDPDVDLATVRDGIGKASYILPAPAEPPPLLRNIGG